MPPRQRASCVYYLPAFHTFTVGIAELDFLFEKALSTCSRRLGRVSNKSLSSITTPPTIWRSSRSVWCIGTSRLRCQPRSANIFLNCIWDRSHTSTNSRPWPSSSMKPFRCIPLHPLSQRYQSRHTLPTNTLSGVSDHLIASSPG